MKYENLRDYKFTGTSALDWVEYATVDCSQKAWPWSKTVVEQKPIARAYAGSWFFTESGKYCPDSQEIDALVRAHKFATGVINQRGRP